VELNKRKFDSLLDRGLIVCNVEYWRGRNFVVKDLIEEYKYRQNSYAMSVVKPLV
jgi:hypothetical protein